MSLGRRIAKLRKENGLLQKNLAGVLGVSIGTVSNYEHDTHQPDLGVLVMLADYFSVTVDYLLGRTMFRHALYCADETPLNNGHNLSDFLSHCSSLESDERLELFKRQIELEKSFLDDNGE